MICMKLLVVVRGLGAWRDSWFKILARLSITLPICQLFARPQRAPSYNDDHHQTPLMDVPELSPTPSQYAHCCVSLSTSIVSTIRDVLPRSPNTTLSIAVEAISLKP